MTKTNYLNYIKPVEDKTYSMVLYNIFRKIVFTKVKIYMGSKEGAPKE